MCFIKSVFVNTANSLSRICCAVKASNSTMPNGKAKHPSDFFPGHFVLTQTIRHDFLAEVVDSSMSTEMGRDSLVIALHSLLRFSLELIQSSKWNFIVNVSPPLYLNHWLAEDHKVRDKLRKVDYSQHCSKLYASTLMQKSLDQHFAYQSFVQVYLFQLLYGKYCFCDHIFFALWRLADSVCEHRY